MSLDAALSIANSGLAAVQRALAQASQNVGNANTAGYTAKRIDQSSVTLDVQPMGVRTGQVQRSVDQALIQQIGASTSDKAAATLRESLLQGVEDAYGSVSDSGSNSSLSDHVGALQAAFVTLRGTPEDTGAQRNVVTAARAVAQDFNAVGSAITAARQSAQDSIVSQVSVVNAKLRQVASITGQIKAETAKGGSTADLEDQRDLLLGGLSSSLGFNTVQQQDGGVLLISKGGLVLPLRADQDAFAVSNAVVGPTSYYGAGGTLPGVTMAGVDVTRQLQGGTLGEAISLRDSTLPRFQAEADTAASELAYRFDQQGLTLFTNANGTVPDVTQPYTTGGQAGFAGTIQVSSTVQANQTLVRDGTRAVSTGAGGLTNFTPNPATGPAGFSTLAGNILDYTFGAQAANGTGWPAIPTTGLGPDGTLSSSFTAPAKLQDYVQDVQSTQTAERADATTAKTQSGDMLATLQQRFTTNSGVSIDNEMTAIIQLQNSYSANARVMSTVQQMWDSLLQAVR